MKPPVTVSMCIVNMDEFGDKAEEMAALVRRISRLPVALVPPISNRLLELFDVLHDAPVCLRSEGELKAALGAGELGIRVDFAPRVLELIAAIRAVEGKGE